MHSVTYEVLWSYENQYKISSIEMITDLKRWLTLDTDYRNDYERDFTYYLSTDWQIQCFHWLLGLRTNERDFITNLLLLSIEYNK